MKTLLRFDSQVGIDGTSMELSDGSQRNMYKSFEFRKVEGVKSIELLQFRFPFTEYNIIADPPLTNNQIVFDDGAPATATITPAAYDITSLATAIESAMNTAGLQVYTVTVNTLTLRVTISAPGNFDLTVPAATAGNPYGLGIWPMLGFDNSQTLTGANTYTALFPYDMFYYLKYVDVQVGVNGSPLYSTPFNLITTPGRHSFKIPIGAEIVSGDTLEFKSKRDFPQVMEFPESARRDVASLQFRLVYGPGVQMDKNRNIGYDMLLCLHS